MGILLLYIEHIQCIHVLIVNGVKQYMAPIKLPDLRHKWILMNPEDNIYNWKWECTACFTSTKAPNSNICPDAVMLWGQEVYDKAYKLGKDDTIEAYKYLESCRVKQ